MLQCRRASGGIFGQPHAVASSRRISCEEFTDADFVIHDQNLVARHSAAFLASH